MKPKQTDPVCRQSPRLNAVVLEPGPDKFIDRDTTSKHSHLKIQDNKASALLGPATCANIKTNPDAHNLSIPQCNVVLEALSPSKEWKRASTKKIGKRTNSNASTPRYDPCDQISSIDSRPCTPREKIVKSSTPDCSSAQRELRKLEDYWTKNDPLPDDSPRLRNNRKHTIDRNEDVTKSGIREERSCLTANAADVAAAAAAAAVVVESGSLPESPIPSRRKKHDRASSTVTKLTDPTDSNTIQPGYSQTMQQQQQHKIHGRKSSDDHDRTERNDYIVKNKNKLLCHSPSVDDVDQYDSERHDVCIKQEQDLDAIRPQSPYVNNKELDYIPPRKKLRSEMSQDELWDGIPLSVTFKRLVPLQSSNTPIHLTEKEEPKIHGNTNKVETLNDDVNITVNEDSSHDGQQGFEHGHISSIKQEVDTLDTTIPYIDHNYTSDCAVDESQTQCRDHKSRCKKKSQKYTASERKRNSRTAKQNRNRSCKVETLSDTVDAVGIHIKEEATDDLPDADAYPHMKDVPQSNAVCLSPSKCIGMIKDELYLFEKSGTNHSSSDCACAVKTLSNSKQLLEHSETNLGDGETDNRNGKKNGSSVSAEEQNNGGLKASVSCTLDSLLGMPPETSTIESTSRADSHSGTLADVKEETSDQNDLVPQYHDDTRRHSLRLIKEKGTCSSLTNTEIAKVSSPKMGSDSKVCTGFDANVKEAKISKDIKIKSDHIIWEKAKKKKHTYAEDKIEKKAKVKTKSVPPLKIKLTHPLKCLKKADTSKPKTTLPVATSKHKGDVKSNKSPSKTIEKKNKIKTSRKVTEEPVPSTSTGKTSGGKKGFTPVKKTKKPKQTVTKSKAWCSSSRELRITTERRHSIVEELGSNTLLNKHACVIWSSENRRHVQLSHPGATPSELDEILRHKWDDLTDREKLRYFQRARNASRDENRHSDKHVEVTAGPNQLSDNPCTQKFLAMDSGRQLSELKKWLHFYHDVSPEEYSRVMTEFKEALSKDKKERESREKEKCSKSKTTRSRRKMKESETEGCHARYRRMLFEKVFSYKDKILGIWADKREQQARRLRDTYKGTVRRLISGEVVEFVGDVRSDKLTETLRDIRSLEEERKIAVSGEATEMTDRERRDLMNRETTSPGRVGKIDEILKDVDIDMEHLEEIVREVQFSDLPNLCPEAVEQLLDSGSEQVHLGSIAPVTSASPQAGPSTSQPDTQLTNWVVEDLIKSNPNLGFRGAVSLLSNKIHPSPAFIVPGRGQLMMATESRIRPGLNVSGNCNILRHHPREEYNMRTTRANTSQEHVVNTTFVPMPAHASSSYRKYMSIPADEADTIAVSVMAVADRQREIKRTILTGVEGCANE